MGSAKAAGPSGGDPTSGPAADRWPNASRRDERHLSVAARLSPAAKGAIEEPAEATVLIVEDNPDHADLVTVMLGQARGARWTVHLSGDLRAAIEWLSQAPVDVVLLDLNLPDSWGLETVANLCMRAPEVPVVVVTAHHDEAIGLAAMQSGAQDYLIKGQFEAGTLSRTLRFAIERKRGEVAVGRLAAIVENSTDAVFSKSLDGLILTWNAGAETMFGYSAAEACGRDVEMLVPPEHMDEVASVMRRLRRGERVETFETRRRTRDGRLIDVSVSISPILDRAGRMAAASVITRDISERRRAEGALQARSRQQAAVARLGQVALSGAGTTSIMQEAAALVVETLDVEASAVLEILPGGQEFLLKAGVGWRTEQVGTLLLSAGTQSQAGYAVLSKGAVIAPDLGRETRFSPWAVLRNQGVISSVSVLLSGRQGPLGVVEAHTLHPRLFTENDVHFLESLATVIAGAVERQQAEDDVNRFFALSLEMLAILGYDGAFRQVNPAWEKTLGFSLDELKAHALAALAHPEDSPRVLAEWERLCGAGAPAVDFEARYRCRDGSFRSLVWSCRADPERRLVYAAVRDMTERRRLEEQLLHSQKMEAIGQLAGGVAHDFNNLLGVITGYGDLLLRDMSRDDPRCRRVEEIRKAADRAASLTRQLLAFGRKQVLEPKVLDLNGVVTNIERMLPRLIGEHIRLVTALAPGLGAVRADQGQIEQVIVNLAVNARDAMPEGGRLIIETANVEVGTDQAAQSPGAQPGPHILLSVSDTGHGMNAETLARVFEPFFTTKEAGKGTGLGLATVYGIVQQSGGHLTAWSEPGQGATFRILLPRVSTMVEAPAPRALPPLPRLGRETVLVAEDEPALRGIIRETLQTSGYTVLVAADAEEAISAARRHSGPIHLLLTDVVMPRMTGWEAAARIRAERDEVKVLFMSGYTEDVLGHPDLLGGDLLLQKPFTADVLLRRLREFLDN